MKTNTYCENSRPRSVKPKKRTGFTMMEMMITLAIMAILFGLAVPAVAAIQKNLEIARLNSYAKDIYFAAQNRLTSLKATGELVELRDVLQNEYSGEGTTKNRYYGPSDPENMTATSFKPQDWDDSWDSGTSAYKKYYNFYGIMHNPTDAADDDAVCTEIIPALSVTSTTLDNHYYIEFNPTTGDVYAVFYTDATTGFTSDDIKALERGEQTDGSDSQRRKEFLRDDFVNSAGDNVMVGYYRGDPTDMLEDKEITEYDVTCELVNKEDLYIKVTCDLGDTYFLRKFVEASITLTNADTGVSMEIPINLAAADSLRTYDRSALATNNFMMFGYDATETTKFVAYILLDAADEATILNGTSYSSIIAGVADKYKDANAGKDLSGLVDAVNEGCNLQASANVELNFADRIVRTNTTNSTDEHLQHSRFAAVSDDGKTVKVGYVRHLKNLDGYKATGNSLTIDQSCVEYVVETYIDEETGEEKTRTVEQTKGDIYFNSKYTTADGDTKWYWTSDYLIGEPKGDALRNYLNAPTAEDEAYITPISFSFADGYNRAVTYNGNYYGLYDFVIDDVSAGNYAGLFRTLINAKVNDVNLIDATVDGKDTVSGVGAFVGGASGCEFNNVGVRLTDRDPVNNQYYTDMANRVDTKKVYSETALDVGGIVGYAKNCDFYYSYAAIQVESTANTTETTAGGLVGYAANCDFKGCYTSEPTIGGQYVGGFVGWMVGGSAIAEQNGTDVYPLYATGDVTGSKYVGGFVGAATAGAQIDGCNSYGRVRVTEGTTGNYFLGGFVSRASHGTSFSNNSYLKQTRYNTGTGFQSQTGYATARSYTDATAYNGNSYWNVMTDTDEDNDNTAEDSHPYTIYNRTNVFPFVMTKKSMSEGYDEIPHYGDWPVEASIQTMLAYYEVYENDDGSSSVGLYGYTSLVGESAENANKWLLNTLQTGDTYCVEDGYAIVSTDMVTNISGTIETLGKNVSVNYTQSDYSMTVGFTSDDTTRKENVYVYKLSDLDVQGMSTAYQTRMSDSNGTYFQKMVLSGVYNSDEVFTDYTFFYCPVLAKAAVNPTPAQTEDSSLCPSTAAMEINKPEAGIIRSARQLNAMGRMNWFWSMNLNQECHVDFGKYTTSYCGTTIDLTSEGQVVSNQWRNKPIGSNTTTYGEKPYTGNYNGNYYKIIDYCLYVSEDSDSTDAGLFGLLYTGSLRNIVLTASDPNANSGAGTAWVKSTMTQGNGSYNIAPLVGQVKYDSAAMGTVDRVLNSWGVSGDTFNKSSSSLSTSTGTLKIEYNQAGGDGTLSGSWSTNKTKFTPASSHETVIVTVTGEFGMADSATLTTYSGTTALPSVSAKTIAANTLVFEIGTDYFTNNGVSNLGGTMEIALTGGDTSSWAFDNTSVMVELHTDEPLVPTGDDPEDYLTKLSNMSTVENCAVAGYIVDYTPNGTQTKAVNMGGLVGKNQGEIYNCSVSNKKLAASGSNGDTERRIGGFAGVNDAGIIADCYSGGLLAAMGTQPAYVGGLVGKQEGSATTWHAAGTMLLSSYSYCQIEKNASASTIHYNGVAGGSESMVKHCHFYENAIDDYSEDVFDALEDGSRTYTATIKGEEVDVPYSLSYAKMKRLFSGGAYALFGDSGTADYDHSWPFNTTLVGSYPFPATVKASDGYYIHYGDWPAPNGTIYNNSASFSGVYWVDFCVDATDWKTDYSYYWGEWLKEMKYQASLGNLKEGDFIEIIVEPEFEYDAPEACGLFQCGIHTMMANTDGHFTDDENDASYEAQGINFGNGQVYHFLFDVEAVLEIENDPQLWFAINYNSSGGAEGKLWNSVKDNYEGAGNQNPFRLNRLTVNIYREDSSTTTTNASTRKSSTSTSPGGATEAETATHLELLKEWTFENGETNILSTDKGSQLAGDISTELFAGNTASGHSNHIKLENAESFRMDISAAFDNEAALLEGEYYQVEATFALGDDATADMSMRPYLVSGDNVYYANTYTLVQKRTDSGANAGKVIWANALYTFGTEGMVIDDDAYIVWIPRESSSAGSTNTLNGDLYVDNISVKKVVQGADPTATESTEATVPYEEDEGKLVLHWSCDHASGVELPTYSTNPDDAYRKINLDGTCIDPTTKVKWTDFVKNLEGLSDSQYMVVTLTYPEGYTHADKDSFTFTCDSFAYRADDGGEDIVLSEIDTATGDGAFDAETRTVKWVIGGPLVRSAVADYGHSTKTFFTYRNALDLVDETVLKSNEDEFTIDVSVYDRDPDATAITVPTTTASRTTRQLSGGTATYTWAADTLGDNKYMSLGYDDEGYVGGDRNNTMTWQEFATMVGALGDSQYIRVTLTNSDGAFSGLSVGGPKVNLNTYTGVDGEVFRSEAAVTVNANTIVYQLNGPMDLNTVASNGSKTGYEDAGFSFADIDSDVGLSTSILVEIMSTATTATLQGDDFDVRAGDVVSETATITLNGDTFTGLATNDDITSWFTGLGGRGLTATVASVNENVLTVNILGTVTTTPESTITVTATVPGTNMTLGGTDVTATGSFEIHKKVPRAEIVGDAARSFYVNEALTNPSNVVSIKLTNDTFGDISGTVGTDWFTGTVPSDWTIQVSKTSDTVVTITFAGTPSEQASIPLTFKVPASVLTASTTDLDAGTVTFSVISRPQVDDPIFGLAEGTYRGNRNLTITCGTSDADVYYKVDDAADWTLYVNPILLTEGTHTVSAYAEKTDYLDSSVVQKTYTILQDNNLIKNGYFDDDLEGWTVSDSGSSAVSVVNGVLTVTDFSSGSNDLIITASLKDGYTIKAETEYTLSFNMNGDTGLKVKVLPGGNKTTTYTESGTYTFTTLGSSSLSSFSIYISAPKGGTSYSGTFDNFVLSEGSGSATESSATVTSQTSATVTETTNTTSESSTTETSTSTGRTKVAQWVTTNGVSYTFQKDAYDEAYVQVYGGCNGMKDGTTAMTWKEFIASIDDVTSDQYFEIAFTHVDGESFYGVNNTTTKLDNTGYDPEDTTLVSADDLKVLFETSGALTYLGESGPMLDATFRETTGVPAETDVICTVTLYEGDHGGDTSEVSDTSETSATATATSATSTETSETSETSTPSATTNLLINGDFLVTDENASDFGWGFVSGINGKTLSSGSFTITNGNSGSVGMYQDVAFTAGVEYTLKLDMTVTTGPVDIRLYNTTADTYVSVGTLAAGTHTDETFKFTAAAGDNRLMFGGYRMAYTITRAVLTGGSGTTPTTAPTVASYTVTVNGGNADKTSAHAGDTITLTPPTTAPEGKEFDSWNVISGGVTVTDNSFTMPAANVEIEATYKWIEYSITVYNGNANGESTAHLGDTIQLNANEPETGYTFSHWTVDAPAGLTLADANASLTTFTMPAADVSVTAEYEKIDYTVTVNTNDSSMGTAQVVGDATTANCGDNVSVSATPAEGYRFVSWTVSGVTVADDTVNPLGFVMPAGNVTLTANFEEIVVPKHTVTVVGGVITGSSETTATVAEGDTVSVTANAPETGYEFKNWTAEGVTLSTTTTETVSFTMPTGDVTVTANFEKVAYNVNCSTVSNGSISANKTTAYYGDTVELTAEPATGYDFGGWTVSGATVTDNAFTMPAADVTVSATFVPHNYTITVENDTTKGTVSAQATATYNGNVSITVTPETGWIFSGFTTSDGVTLNNTSDGCTFTMPAKDITLTATYTMDTENALASWSTTSGAGTVNYTNGTAGVGVAGNTLGTSGVTFAEFVDSVSDLNESQYMKVTYTRSSGKFGNARRAATTLTMSALSGGTTMVTYADDETIVAYIVGASAKTADAAFTASWTNASAVPATTDITVTVEIYNFTTSPISGISTDDVTADYTVTVNGGTASPSSAKANATVTVTPTVPSGKKFTGWTVDGTDYLYAATVAPGSTANPLTFTMPYNDVTLTANFEDIPTYNVTCADGVTGGTISASPTSAMEGETVTLTATPATGYTFVSWNVTGATVASATAITTTFTMPANDVEVSATFEKVEYAVTLGAVTNGTITADKTTACYGDTVTLTATPDSGYTFGEWTVSGGITVTDNAFTMPANDVTVTATFTEQSATTNLLINGDFLVTDENASDFGWGFVSGINGKTLSSGSFTITNGNSGSVGMYQDVAFTAGVEYTLTVDMTVTTGPVDIRLYNTTADTYVSVGTLAAGSHTGKTVTFTAAAGDNRLMFGGYRMAYTITNAVLTGPGGGSAETTAATTEAASYTVTWDSVTGGTISASPTSAKAGEVVTLTATPATGYTFSGWTVSGGTLADASSASTTLTMPAANVTVSATFQEESGGEGYTVTVSGTYLPGKYDSMTDIPSLPDATAFTNGSTATVVVSYSDWYKATEAKALNAVVLTANDETLTPTVTLESLGSNNFKVTMTYTFTVSEDTTVSITSTQADYKVPTVTLS